MLGSLTIPKQKDEVAGQDGLTMFQAVDQITYNIRKNRTIRLKSKHDEDGRLVFTSPDLPGLVTDGADVSDALRNAVDAIQALLQSAGENVKDMDITLIYDTI